MASLSIVVDGVQQRFPLESAAVTLGRGLESDIRLKDIKASRRHCQVVKTPKGYQCVDLSSGNGTYVNGVQIKSQLLGSGDKITIGSTTISFEETVAAAAKAPGTRPVTAKSPTAKLPVVPATAKAPAPKAPAGGGDGSTATPKIPTARVPTAPTRKVSSKMLEAVNPASQSALRPASGPLPKTASRVGKPVSATRSTRPRPAPAEPSKKKSPVVLIAIVAAVVLLGGGGAYYFLTAREGGDPVGAQVNQMIKKAEAAEKEEKFAAAIAEYRKALELCQGEKYKYRASELTHRISQLEARRGGDAPPKTDSSPKDPPEKGPDFQAKKTEIAEKHKLAGEPAAADWSGAVKDWTDFSKGKLAADLKSKIEAEIRAIHAKAKQELDRLRKKADALAAENKMAEALDLLKQQKTRFEHTELQAELDAAIRQYDK